MATQNSEPRRGRHSKARGEAPGDRVRSGEAIPRAQRQSATNVRANRVTTIAVPALLALALFLRLMLVLREPAAPLYWDEQLYHSDAQRFALGWRALGQGGWTSMEYLRGTSGKGEAYSAAVGLAYVTFGVRSQPVFVAQAVLDTLTCWFIYLLTRRVAGRTAGLLALAAAAVYEPFIFSAARLQSETVASFLYLAALVALSAAGRYRVVWCAIAGVILGAAALAKSALQFLALALAPAIFASDDGRTWKARTVCALVLVAGFLGVMGARMATWNAMAGDAPPSAAADMGVAVFVASSLDDLGWLTGQCCTADKVQATLGAPPSHTPPAGSDYWMAAVHGWTVHPVQHVGVLLHRLYRSWRHPYNDSRRKLLTSFAGQRSFHQLMLLLGTIGIVVALRRWRTAAPMIGTAAYLWIVHLPVPIEVRYTVTVMPLMICFAGIGAAAVIEAAAIIWRQGGQRRLLALAAIVGLGLFLVHWATVPRFAQVFSSFAPDTAHTLRVALQVMLIAFVTYAVVEILSRQWGYWAAVRTIVPAAILAILVLLAGGAFADSWRAWKAPMRAGTVIEQTFQLPNSAEPPISASLRMDLLPTCHGNYDLVVRANGREIHRYRGEVKRQDADSLGAFLIGPMLAGRGEDRNAPHAWYAVPVPVTALADTQSLQVELELENDVSSRSCLAVVGDYGEDPSVYDGPSIWAPQQPSDISLNKLLVTGDFRLRRRSRLSGAARSRLQEGGQWSDADLSAAPGRQTGRYRIFLVLNYSGKVLVN